MNFHKLLEYHFRVEDLQNVLKSFNLPISGRKSELLERVLSLINSRQYEPEFIVKVKQKIKQEYQLRVAKPIVSIELTHINTPFDKSNVLSNKHSTKNASKKVKDDRNKASKCYEYDTDYGCSSDSSDIESVDTTTQNSTTSDDSESDHRDWNPKKGNKKVNGFIRDGISINSKQHRKSVPQRRNGKIASKKSNKSSRKRQRRIVTSFSTSEDSSSEDCATLPKKKTFKSNAIVDSSSDESTTKQVPRKSIKSNAMTSIRNAFYSSSSNSSSSVEPMDHQSVEHNKTENSLPQKRVENENNKNLCNNKANEKSDDNTVVMEIDDDSDDDIQIIEVVNKPVVSSVTTDVVTDVADNDQQPPQSPSSVQPLVVPQPPSIDSIGSDSNFASQEDSLDDYDNIVTPNVSFSPQDDAIEKTNEIPLSTEPIEPPIITNQNTVSLSTCDTNLEDRSENLNEVNNDNIENNCDKLKDDIEEGELVDDIKPLLPEPKPLVPEITKKEEVIPKQLPYEGVLDCYKPQIIIVNIPKVDLPTKPDLPILPHCVSLRLIDPQITLSQIKQRVVDSDSEIEALDKNLRIPLICPITNRRISIPGRSENCVHLDCFDVIPFIVLNSKKPMNSWRCPKCKQPAELHNLIIDGLLKHILKTTEETCEAVVFDQTVIWRPESNKHDTDHSTEKLDVSIVDLVDLDDDDDDKVQNNEPTMTIAAAKQLADTLKQKLCSESNINNVQLNYNTQTKQIHFVRPASNIFRDLQINASQTSVEQRAVPQQQPNRVVTQQQQSHQRTSSQQQSTQRTAQPKPGYRDLLSTVLSARPKPKEIPLHPTNDRNTRENSSSCYQPNNVTNSFSNARNASSNDTSSTSESSTRDTVNNARRPILAPSVVKAASAVSHKQYLMAHIAILGSDLITKNGDVLRKAGQLYCELCCVPLGYHRTETHTNKNVDTHVKGTNHQLKLKALNTNNEKSVNSNQTNTNKVTANKVPIGSNINNNAQNRTQALNSTSAPNAAVFQTQSTFVIPEPNQHMSFIQYNNFGAGNYGLQTSFIPQQNKSQYNPSSAPPPAHQRAPHPPQNYQSNNYSDFYYFPPNFAHQYNSYYPNYSQPNQYNYNNRQT